MVYRYVFYIFLILLTFYLALSNFLLLFFYCCFLFFLKFSLLTGLSSLLGPMGFWLLAFPVGVCSLECNNNNNNNNNNVTFLKLTLMFLSNKYVT